jgi:alpha-L-rhamnosidase
VPTDCPHRERGPWTGDWQLYVPTAAVVYDVAGFSTKWLGDVAADQWPDGTIANVSPSPRNEGREGPIAALNGSAGWGDAAVIVPWELYRAYRDERILAELEPTMVRWLDRAQRLAREQRHPSRVERSAAPAPHERYLWDTGFHWGEWLEPGDDSGEDLDSLTNADRGDVATAYFAYSARLMARIAALLGKDDDAARYAELSDNARAAWQAEYLDADGGLTPDTQANYVRALAFDLVPPRLRSTVAERLVELIRKADTHLGTGFLATPYLLPVLADTGHLDVAYELLFQDSEPSWLVMIDRGATTVWERWNGVSADGVPTESLNHYSKGAVISFLHRYVAGIELLEPAYRRFRVQPRPGSGLTAAEAVHESPYGRIESAWQLDSGVFQLRVVVPAGTNAELVLPDGSATVAGPGEHRRTCTLARDEAP